MTVKPFHPVHAVRKRLSISARMRDIVLTILLWFVYLFFMKDFFLFFADAVRWAWNGFADTASYASFKILPTFLSYVEITAGFFVVYIGWAKYNQLRFRGKSRRKAAGPVRMEELAAFYGLDLNQVEELQRARTLTIHHDGKGHVIGIQ